MQNFRSKFTNIDYNNFESTVRKEWKFYRVTDIPNVNFMKYGSWEFRFPISSITAGSSETKDGLKVKSGGEPIKFNCQLFMIRWPEGFLNPTIVEDAKDKFLSALSLADNVLVFNIIPKSSHLPKSDGYKNLMEYFKTKSNKFQYCHADGILNIFPEIEKYLKKFEQ